MPKLTLALTERKEVAERTMGFRFDLGGQPFSFKPGQFVRLLLPEPPFTDAKGNSRTFSIASSPRDPFLLVAVRMTDTAFKRSLAAVPLGTKVVVTNPIGVFVLDEAAADKAVALFAGGIGVTPFRSMIKHAVEEHSPRPLTLVYSNRRSADAAFLDELADAAKQHPRLRLLATMTQPDAAGDVAGTLTGRVDAAFVKKHLPEIDQTLCYVAGPPRFVNGVSEELLRAGVSPERVLKDEFDGY